MSADDTLPMFDNPIIELGELVSFGAMPYQKALERASTSEDFHSLPDEPLVALLDAADLFWRQQETLHPTNRVIFPHLCVEIAQARLKPVADVARLEGEGSQAKLRQAAWIGRLARYKISLGMALLSIPNPEAAFRAFMEGNFTARGLPDFGQLRLAEVMAAAYGMRVAAQMGGPPELRQRAEAEWQGLNRLPGREAEANSYRIQIEQQFDRIRNSLQTRQRPKSSAEEIEDLKEDPAQYYRTQLTALAHVVHMGHKSMDEAFKTLLDEVDPRQVSARDVYFVSVMHRGLKDTNSELATILAELNYRFIQHVEDPQKELAQVECAIECGAAWTKHGFQNKHDKDSYRKAVPYLRIGLAQRDDGRDYTADQRAYLSSLLGMCLRGLEDLEGAREAFQNAVDRLRNAEDKNLRQMFATAIGNLADVQERIGKQDDAMDNHLTALRVFLEVGDFGNARQALSTLPHLALQLGRVDHALEAYGEAADAAVNAAQLDWAVECLTSVARWSWLLRRVHECFQALTRADRLLNVARDKEALPHLRQRLELLTLGASFYIAIHSLDQDEDSFASAQDMLQKALSIARQIGEAEVIANPLLQLAVLQIESGKLDDAENSVEEALQLDIKGALTGRRAEVIGRLRVDQGRFKEAEECFDAALTNYDETDIGVRRFSVYEGMGMCHEAAGSLEKAAAAYEDAIEYFDSRRKLLSETARADFVGNAEQVATRLITLYADPNRSTHDPWKALYWFEKTKSRTLADRLQHARLHLVSPSQEATGLINDEQQRLARLHRIRVQMSDIKVRGSQRLQLNEEFQDELSQLHRVWDQLVQIMPEYVEMRRGIDLTWEDVTGLIA